MTHAVNYNIFVGGHVLVLTSFVRDDFMPYVNLFELRVADAQGVITSLFCNVSPPLFPTSRSQSHLQISMVVKTLPKCLNSHRIPQLHSLGLILFA